MDENIIRIEDLVAILKKRWRMILVITTISTLISIIISFFIISPKYETDTKVFIGKENSQNLNYSDNDVQMYQKLLKTYAEVITTDDLVENAINSEDLDVTSKEVLNNLTVTPRADTQILEIQYSNKNNELAKDVLDAVTNEFIKSSKELIPNGNVTIIESAKLPETPVSPNKKMNIVIGFLIGLMISIGLSLLIEFMNNTLKTRAQLEEMLDLPVIGTIPNELEQRRSYNV